MGAQVHDFDLEREIRENRKKIEKFTRVIESRKPASRLDLSPHRDAGFFISIDKGYFLEEDKVHILSFENSRDLIDPIGSLRLTRAQWNQLKNEVDDSFEGHEPVNR